MDVQDATDRLYKNTVILAPMVRAGTLPFRALALRYGADTVFTEEVIDRRIVNAVRTENRVLETVDYVESRGKKPPAVPFQTCALERDRLVYQIGTGNAVYALKAAQHVERDVAAVDINMGCPKRFSLQGGMGAALLKKPEVAADIIGTLRRNLSVPVSIKIRLLDSPTDTVEFVKRMEKAGACAVTVHTRRLEDKPASKARWEELRAVVDAVNIPVVANGDVYSRDDMGSIKAVSGCSSVMLARPALLNCSIFRTDGKMLPLKEVIRQYVLECARYDALYQNAKYTVMEMITKRRHPDHLKAAIRVDLPQDAPGMQEVTATKTLEQLAMLWDVDAEYKAELDRREARANQLGGAGGGARAERSSVHHFDDAYFLMPASNKQFARVARPTCRGDANKDGGRTDDVPHESCLAVNGRASASNIMGDGSCGDTRDDAGGSDSETRISNRTSAVVSGDALVTSSGEAPGNIPLDCELHIAMEGGDVAPRKASSTPLEDQASRGRGIVVSTASESLDTSAVASSGCIQLVDTHDVGKAEPESHGHIRDMQDIGNLVSPEECFDQQPGTNAKRPRKEAAI